jgi:hypothetical protein
MRLQQLDYRIYLHKHRNAKSLTTPLNNRTRVLDSKSIQLYQLDNNEPDNLQTRSIEASAPL